MIKKVYEIDPLLCPMCYGQMKIIAFITDYSLIDRIVNRLNLHFFSERLPPFSEHLLYKAEESASDYYNGFVDSDQTGSQF